MCKTSICCCLMILLGLLTLVGQLFQQDGRCRVSLDAPAASIGVSTLTDARVEVPKRGVVEKRSMRSLCAQVGKNQLHYECVRSLI